MSCRIHAFALTFALTLPFAFSCAGSTTSENGDGDSSGDGDGDTCPERGSGPQINHGILAACVEDTDCLAVSVTDDACYSPGCELPIAASIADAACDPCLVEWDGLAAPMISEDCAFMSNGGDVSCPLGCAAPPTCIHAYCDAGECRVNTSQGGSDCTQ